MFESGFYFGTGWSLLQLVFTAIVLTYNPLAVYQTFLIASSLLHKDGDYLARQTPLVKSNRAIVVITTNGLATDVVEMIIAKIRGYGLPLGRDGDGIFVIKEERDKFVYSCRMITVPSGYVSGNRSRNKMRALQYGIEWLHRNGYGKETYVCHLDDDSVVDREYLDYVIRYLRAEGAQGCIRLRMFGRHTISSLSDIIRISNCEAWCKHSNKRSRPQFVHGEGLVVRADIEYEIGWDYATYGAEDLIMGLEISKRYRFDYIPTGHIFIAPPTSVTDYYKQRRRWFWSIFKNDGKVRALSPKTYLVYMYMYLAGMSGLLGLILFPTLVTAGVDIPPAVLFLSIMNFVFFMLYYQFGAFENNDLWCALALLVLQVPVSFYEGFTSVYALIRPPDFEVFETIKKV